MTGLFRQVVSLLRPLALTNLFVLGLASCAMAQVPPYELHADPLHPQPFVPPLLERPDGRIPDGEASYGGEPAPAPPGAEGNYDYYRENGSDSGVAKPDSDSADGADSDYLSDEEYEAAAKDAVARERQYGEPSISTTRSFLRTQTPLLRPGQTQWDFGFQYSLLEADFPALSGANLTEANIASRRLDTLLGFRYGVTERMQFFGNTTVGWQRTDFFDGFTAIDEDAGGIGDINLGLNYLLRPEDACRSSIILTTDVTLPTGNEVDPLLLTDGGMGSGAWATSTRLLAVRSIDPVVLFWGAGYRLTFEDSYRNNQIDLGDQFLYNLGLGFAASESITLSAAYEGAFVTNVEVNGVDIEGSSFDLGAIRLAATIAKCGKIYEPFLQFGVTDRSPATAIGFVLTR